jgi:predicted RNA-binding protein associated with RNAse of E/G family
MKPIKIISRLGEINGYGNDEVVFFDRFDEKSNKDTRHFVLMNEGIKLMYEPWGWKDEWYADLIHIGKYNEDTIELKYMYIDVVIEGNGPTYRIIDLEEYADAVNQGIISLKDLRKQFIQLQLFLDNYLHRGKEFPPKVIIDLMYGIE